MKNNKLVIIAQEVTRRIDSGEYWEDVMVEMREQKKISSTEVFYKVFKNVTGYDISEYAVE
jgi:hypothetical protein